MVTDTVIMAVLCTCEVCRFNFLWFKDEPPVPAICGDYREHDPEPRTQAWPVSSPENFAASSRSR